ncbi:TetR/AcrR family transcriptional regulator [Uliginosibacterium gangwonense]|uniref:TetR/AcrR family transcriptional regulator n=1 Tax=Uliginosibacterium gangwonense TaxID=392736 RepID=UPI000381A5F4|nr:TetR/AcrR family transcriptional regulator [Uliginosibacterium gangwonense]
MSNTPLPRSSHREALLDAAEAIVSEQGVAELTLEGVAARTGVTKGGLIYHFKTKEALLHALVEKIIQQMETRYQEKAKAQGSSLDILLIAMINDVFDMSREEKALMTNLLAAVSSYPNQLGPVQDMYERQTQELTRDPQHMGLALMVSCALDGIIFLELLNLKQFSTEEREAMRQHLINTVTQHTKI